MAKFLAIAVALSIVFGLTASKEAELVLLKDPGEALCLDGSPPGYYFRPGLGKNASKAIVFLEGGSACFNEQECLERSKTRLGSSNFWPPTAEFSGFLSDVQSENPDFYDWNVTFINYCDGGFHSGYVSHPVDVEGTLLYFRGYKILQTMFQSLLEKGLNEATDVILTGCSAGGLATYIHADYVKSILPPSVKYRAISDAGYFIIVPNVDGKDIAKERVIHVFKMQNVTSELIAECYKYYNASEMLKCLDIQSPIFALNSQYDTWQIDNDLQLKCYPPNCTTEQMKKLEEFHEEFMKAVEPIISSVTNGAFLNSCFAHCQSLNTNGWTRMKVGGQTVAETFGNWYFERSGGGSSKEIDCPYPCNKSC